MALLLQLPKTKMAKTMLALLLRWSCSSSSFSWDKAVGFQDDDSPFVAAAAKKWSWLDLLLRVSCILWLSRREVGSPASVSLLLHLRVLERVARSNPQLWKQSEWGLVLLLTLPEIYKGVGKYFHNVGVLSWLEVPAKCVPEGCPTLAPLPACYKGVWKSPAMGRHCFI